MAQVVPTLVAQVDRAALALADRNAQAALGQAYRNAQTARATLAQADRDAKAILVQADRNAQTARVDLARTALAQADQDIQSALAQTDQDIQIAPAVQALKDLHDALQYVDQAIQDVLMARVALDQTDQNTQQILDLTQARNALTRVSDVVQELVPTIRVLAQNALKQVKLALNHVAVAFPAHQALEKIIQDNLLLEIIRFNTDQGFGHIALSCFNEITQRQSFYYLNDIKEKIFNPKSMPIDGQPFHPLLTLCKVVDEFGNRRFAGVVERKSAIKILLKYFLKIDDNLLPIPSIDTPFEFAVDCLWILEKTGKNIAKKFIEKYLGSSIRKLDEESNLNDNQIKKLKTFLEPFKDKQKCSKGKNSILTDYLTELGKMRLFNHIEYVRAFCEVNTFIVKDMVLTMLNQALLKNFEFKITEEHVHFAGPKTISRIAQKYSEYQDEYLIGGSDVYKKFKDLFRGTILFDDFMKLDINKLKIASCNVPDTGYKVGYVILNIGTMNFELQVVRNLEKNENSHYWYELTRNDSEENLRVFIRNHISEFDCPISIEMQASNKSDQGHSSQ